jgi:hypothetical protein
MFFAECNVPDTRQRIHLFRVPMGTLGKEPDMGTLSGGIFAECPRWHSAKTDSLPSVVSQTLGKGNSFAECQPGHSTKAPSPSTDAVTAAFLCRVLYVSAFQTREDRQPTSKFVVACPCPDGLMQDGTQEENEAYVISHRGARSRGYKRRERARARARERERERERVPACVRLCLSRLPRLPLCQRLSVCVSTYVHLSVCQRERFRPMP